jgi:ADP-heptose:LPS heptosyltransferase
MSRLLRLLTAVLGAFVPVRAGDAAAPRILVIRRNRMGDMICTLPLLRALRAHFPGAHLAVACDAAGRPIAEACGAVDEVILLDPGWNRWQALIGAALRLRRFDLVLAAKGGFDRRLALLTLLTGAPRRIGFERGAATASAYYSDPLPIPANMWEIHQADAMLLLARPLGIDAPAVTYPDLKLDLPASARDFARAALDDQPGGPLIVINLSSTVRMRFRDADFEELIRRLLAESDAAIVLVGLPADQDRAIALTRRVDSPRVRVVATATPLELAALLESAALLITAEGGAAHLAAATGTRAVVLWFEGPFEKWRSLGPEHVFVRLLRGEEFLPLERAWEAVRAALPLPR